MEIIKELIDRHSIPYNPAKTRLEVAKLKNPDEVINKLEFHSLMIQIDVSNVDHSHWLSELRKKGSILNIPDEKIENAIREGSKQAAIFIANQDALLGPL